MCCAAVDRRDKVGRRLYEVAAACLLVTDDGESATRATIESGLSSGEQRPHPDLTAETQPQDNKAAALMPLPFVDMSAWRVNEGVPPREWGVRDLFPRRNVALLSGEGAAGKTLLLLQLGVAHALGRDWIGTLPEPGPFLYFGAEDDIDEIHRRLADILKHYGADFPDLQGNLHLLTFAGEDAVLGHADHTGLVKPTPLFERLMKAAIEIKPVLIGIDTSADVFAGNENDRSQVRQFVGMLRKMAIAGQRLHHRQFAPEPHRHQFRQRPVRIDRLAQQRAGAGLSDDRQDRQRRGARSEPADAGIQKEQLRTHRQEHRAALAEWRLRPRCRYRLGRQDGQEHTADRLFKALLDRFNRQGRNVSEKAASKNYAPTVFGKEPEAKKYSLKKVDFEDAMRRLFAASQIVVESYGSPSRGTTRLVTR